ncbi:hypothetical protein ES703_29405 [subsurface metagenome]
MPYSREQLQKIYLTLPKDLKEAIFSVENAEKIYQIAQKHQIPEEKISQLAKVTGHILLTVLAVEKLISSLEIELDIDRNTAQKIVQDIKQEIFSPVMPILTKIQQETSPKPIPSPASSPPSLPPPRPKNENIVDLKSLPRP